MPELFNVHTQISERMVVSNIHIDYTFVYKFRLYDIIIVNICFIFGIKMKKV